jgi:L-cysteine S-thiosulfotransferase
LNETARPQGARRVPGGDGPAIAKTAAAFLAGAVLALVIGGAKPAHAQPMAQTEIPLDTTAPAHESPWQRYGNWPQADWGSYNTLRNQQASPPVGKLIPIEGAITGDPAKGKELAFDRRRGGACLACHVLPEALLPGNVGPDLSTIALWGRSDEWLYNYVNDPRVYKPDSIMPPWGTHGLLSDAEIRDIVAYLKTLDRPTTFTDVRDDPARRKKDQPPRDNLDPVENPGMMTLEEGEELFERPGPSGKSCASCHASPAEEFKTWAAQMPRWEARLEKVMSVSEFVARHARATIGDEMPMQGGENLALSMFLAHQANGAPIDVDVQSPGAKEAAERGRQMMEHYKIGQLNFACMDCHDPQKGGNKWIRGQFLTPPETQLGWHPYYRTSQSQIWDLRKRMQWCGVAIRANELEPDAPEYGDIELYLTHLNRGNRLNVPGIGH